MLHDLNSKRYVCWSQLTFPLSYDKFFKLKDFNAWIKQALSDLADNEKFLDEDMFYAVTLSEDGGLQLNIMRELKSKTVLSQEVSELKTEIENVEESLRKTNNTALELNRHLEYLRAMVEIKQSQWVKTPENYPPQ